MKKYENYKSVELEWLGSVPAHWEVKKLKHVVGLNSGDSITAETIHPEGPYPVFGGNGLRGYTDSLTHEGHFVLIGRQGALCGNINYAQGAFFASEHALVATPKVEFATTWLGELLRSMNLGQYSQAAAQPGLSADRLQKLAIPVPPLPEQRAIAAYLDHKTTQLDALLDQKETLLQLLQQKRQALINEALTQGLDPGAPRKPSGVAWLGDVPAHWEVKRLKHLLSNDKYAIKTGPFGSQLKADDLSDDGEIKVVTQRNVLDNDFEKGLSFVSEEKFESLKSFLIDAGDILFTTRGTIGKAAVMPLLSERAILHPCLIKATINHDLLSQEWLLAFVNDSSYFVEGVKMESNSTVIDVIYSGTLKEVVLPIPSLEEQKQIMLELHKKSNILDEATAAILTQIKTLKAYRQSLILEVVTGKVDVRTEAKALAGTASTPSPTRQASQPAPARPVAVGQLGLF
ncbi:restriction endonuclease subunit S [Hymenobacter sp. RP-2-7]|uniref:Restriction endonuclease subunit S n=1 Tax=Hymenobacter polaris TaxID=2682546 RepID=A0A7Y0AIT2_9BACT|nr:restriction endonuclease subunit S [Hymenobacter polaris]NML67967.1 restriction endonuclease subunit S [Hymenobacter polaris]